MHKTTWQKFIFNAFYMKCGLKMIDFRLVMSYNGEYLMTGADRLSIVKRGGIDE